jgi:hypothetical protein
VNQTGSGVSVPQLDRNLPLISYKQRPRNGSIRPEDRIHSGGECGSYRFKNMRLHLPAGFRPRRADTDGESAQEQERERSWDNRASHDGANSCRQAGQTSEERNSRGSEKAHQ